MSSLPHNLAFIGEYERREICDPCCERASSLFRSQERRQEGQLGLFALAHGRRLVHPREPLHPDDRPRAQLRVGQCVASAAREALEDGDGRQPVDAKAEAASVVVDDRLDDVARALGERILESALLIECK